MTNIEKFQNLSIEVQNQLLFISSIQPLRTIEKLASKQFILKEDLEDSIDDISDDVVFDYVKELCEYSSKNSRELYNAIKHNLNIYKESESESDFEIKNLDDEFKIPILLDLFTKYTSYQLEEKLKQLI